MRSEVVDSKVVELQLDNKNFEQNAHSTISTVKKLQDSLNFSVSGSNFDNINDSIKRVNFDPLNRGLETAKSGFSALEAVAFGALANVGVKISNMAIKIATAIPNQIMTGGKSRALNMDQAEFQVSNLTKSLGLEADAWERVQKEADYAVSGTAYGLDVAAKAASQLMASGVEIGDTFDAGNGSSPMAKALRGISGVAAMSGSSYEEITSIFTKVAGSGRMMAEELNQISARGLNASKTLADFINGDHDMWENASESVIEYCKEISEGTKVTEADVREFASKGKINFELFSEAMDAAFGESSQKANETFSGSLSNVKAQLSKIGELFASPLLENGKKVFNGIYEVVKDIRKIIGYSEFLDGFKKLADTIGGGLAGAFQKLHEKLTPTVTAMEKAFEARNAVAEKASGLAESTNKVLSVFRKLSGATDESKESVKEFDSAFGDVKDTVLATIRGDYGNGMERIAALTEAGFDPETIQNYVNELWELTGHDWSNLSDDIYAQVEGNETLGSVVAETSEKVKAGNEEAEESMGPLEHALSGLLNLWGAISNIVGIVRDRIEAAWNSFTGEGGAIGNIAEKFDQIAQAFNTFTIEHGAEIGQVFDGVVNTLLLVVGMLGLAGQAIMKLVSGALKGLGTSLWDIIVWISNTATAIRTWITENQIVEKVLGLVQSAAEAVTGKIRELWDAFMNLPIIQKAVESFGKAFTFLGDNFSAIYDKGSKVLGNFWSMLRNGFKYATDPKQLFSNIKGAFSYLWTQISSSKVIANFREAFGTVKDAITGFFEDLGKNEDGSLNVFGKLQTGFGKFFSGISNSISNFKKTGNLTDFFNNVKLSFQGLWNSVSGSGLFDNIKAGFETAKSAVTGFIDNLGKNEDGTLNSFGKVWEGIKNFKNSIVDAFDIFGKGGSVGDVFSKVKGAFSNLWSAIKSTGLVDNIKGMFASAKTAVVDFIDGLGKNEDGTLNIFGKIWEGIKAFKDNVVNAFDIFKEGGSAGDLFQGIKDAIAGLWESITGSGLGEKVGEIFGNAKDAVVGFLDSLGTNADGSLNTFGKIWEMIKAAFTWISDKVGTVTGKVGDFFEKFQMWDFITGLAGRLKTGFGDFFTAIPGFVSGGIEKFQEFLAKVRELGGFKFENIGQIFAAFKETVGQYVKDNNPFEALVGAFDGIKDNVLSKLEEIGVLDKIIAIKNKIVDFVDGIQMALSNFHLPDVFNKFLGLFGFGGGGGGELADVEEGAEKAKTVFGTIKDAIFGVFGGGGEGGGGGGINWGSLAPVIVRFVGALLLFKGLKSLAGLVTPLRNFFDALSNEHNAKAKFWKKAALLEMAAAIGILAYAFVKIGNMEWGNIGKAAIVVGGIMAALAALCVVVSKFGDAEKMTAAGEAMFKMAEAIGIITIAIAALAFMISKDAGATIGAMASLIIMVGLLAAIQVAMAKFGGKGVEKAGRGLLEMVGAIAIFVLLIAIMKAISWEDLGLGIVKLGVCVLALAGALWLIKTAAGKNAKGAAAAAISIGLCMVLLAAALKIVSTIDPEKLTPAVKAIAVLAIIAAALTFVASKFETGQNALLSIGVCMVLLAAALGIISLINPDRLWPAVGAMTVLAIIAGALIAVSGKFKEAKGVAIAVGVMFALLAGSLLVVSLIDPDRLWPAVGAIAILAGLCAAIIAISGLLNPSIAAIVLVGVLIGLIAFAIYQLALLPAEQLETAATALILGVGAVAALMLVAAAVGALAGPAITGLIIIAAFIAAVGVIAWALGEFGGDDLVSTINKGMDVIVAIFEGLGRALGAFISGINAEAFDSMGEVADHLVDFMTRLQPLNDIGTVDIAPVLEALGIFAGASLAGALDGITSFASELTTGKSSVELVGDDLAALADGFERYAEVMTRFEGIDIDTSALTDAIGEVAIASLAGFADGLASTITEAEEGKTAVETVADDMGALAEGFGKYVEAMAKYDGITIDTTALDDAIAQTAIASLAGFAGGLASIITEAEEGKTAVETVATDMSALAEGFGKYADTMLEYEGITIDTTNLDNLVDEIGKINLQGFISSIGELLLGDDDKTQVEKFSEDMGTLATALVDWQTQMAPIEGITVPSDDINKLKEALDSIKEGGILDSVLGFFGVDTTPDYTSFNEGIKGLGGAINEFSNSLGEDFNEAKMTTATNAIKSLADVGVALGDVDFGGWFHDGVLTNFAEELVAIVPNLNEFAGGFDNTEKFATLAESVKQLATGVSRLTLVKFEDSQLTDNEVVTKVKENVDMLSKMISDLTSLDTSGVDKFVSALDKINSTDISSASKKLEEANKGAEVDTESSAKQGKAMSDAIASGVDSEAIGSALSGALSTALSGVDTSGYKSLGTTLTGAIAAGLSIGYRTLKTVLDTVLSNASEDANVSPYSKIGENVTDKIGTSILKSTAVSSAVAKILSHAKSTAESYKDDFQQAGRYFAEGMGRGISNNTSLVMNEARAMARKALEAAKNELNEHSPSKETYEIGKFFVLGFSNGIEKYTDVAVSASESMAESTTTGLNSAVKAMSDMFLLDDEYQPTITPVLDLSEIQNGANQIDSILSTTPAMGMNFNAIGTNIHDIHDQTSNADLLDALETLGSNLMNVKPGDTYNFGDMTYDDGSNVANALAMLVSAARIERRA